jgi:hypothetical protein
MSQINSRSAVEKFRRLVDEFEELQTLRDRVRRAEETHLQRSSDKKPETKMSHQRRNVKLQ